MRIRRPGRRQDFVQVVHRNTLDQKVDPDGRRYGETAGTPKEQYRADRGRWFVGLARQPYLRAIVYVVVRVREVSARYGRWRRDRRGAAVVPVGRSLSPQEVAARFGHIGLRLGAALPAVRGKIRQYAAV